jgi:plasmid stabilization system protein ParE
VKVEFSEEAKRQARRERAWWRKNRDAKQLFAEELRAAREALSDGPMLEVYGYFEGEPVRRLLLQKTGCHLYYLVLEKENVVRIVAVWGASRGSGPQL